MKILADGLAKISVADEFSGRNSKDCLPNQARCWNSRPDVHIGEIWRGKRLDGLILSLWWKV